MNVSRYWRMARSDPAWFAQRVREEAESRAAGVRHRVRRETDEAIRTAVARSGLARAVASGPAVAAEYFAVLDGSTLNLHAVLPAGVDGPAEVVFARHGRELRAPAEPAPGGRVTAVTVLGAAQGGVPLTPGGWRVGLAVRTARGERAVGLLARAGDDLDGPTAADPPCPRSGARYTPGSSATGHCLLRVTVPEPSAEVVRFERTLARIEIGVRLVAVDAGRLAVRFQARGNGPAHTVAADRDGDGFRVRVPLAAMARDGRGGERVWDVFAEPPGHRPLRLGRHLHDVRDPRRVLRIPQGTVATGPAALLRVRPYYTGNGDLALGCAPVAPSTDAPLEETL
ncbi:serine/threonine-protein kinase [Actinomadura macrotermitis]|uniref:Uncharacterized protein n=1 Tax=Actinomadura macrotermitis TaxID=2585200 RepID=A0A7K0C7B4_9ACTN|nr:hypothetical protein [Actinomadura macrotermitis]MQY09325.1 hypothetical protein [Actinomadura macrotermitis]